MRNGKLIKKKKTRSSTKPKRPFPYGHPLPYSILKDYPGKYVVFSEDECRVIGVGATYTEAYAQAEASGVKGMWHDAYSFPPGDHIA